MQTVAALAWGLQPKRVKEVSRKCRVLVGHAEGFVVLFSSLLLL